MTMASTMRRRSMRADAARNREKILAAARSAFARPGADLSMTAIYERAGAGPGTFYRNFAGRHELLEALYLDELDAICEAAATIEGDTPGARFTNWLERFSAYLATKRHVATELIEHKHPGDAVVGRWRPRVIAAARPLLLAAQAAREIRADLTIEQVLDMVVAIASISGGPDHTNPILRAALDGLRRTRRRADT
jgi:AcrR family transcriptional regulator